MYQFKKFEDIADSRKLSTNILKRDIRWGEVKLFQYLVLSIINNNQLDSTKLRYEEVELLEEYARLGFITYEFALDVLRIKCTEEFENFMYEMLEVAYKK